MWVVIRRKAKRGRLAGAKKAVVAARVACPDGAPRCRAVRQSRRFATRSLKTLKNTKIIIDSHWLGDDNAGATASPEWFAFRGRHFPFRREWPMSLMHLVGQSAWTIALREQISQVAGFSSNVLITGPSGTGKELISRAVHDESARRLKPFVPVDCTALSGELFASHLFGHEAGAFTGAIHARLGCFRAAEGGTLFLDEIGEMSLELQAKLLRAIQERVVVSLGSDEPQAVDVRILAATNRNLLEEVRDGRFRLDLFYRLNVVAIRTLALAERVDEIEGLAVHFLEKFTAEQGLPKKRFSPGAILALLAHTWPGNVRELQNVVERAVVYSKRDVIDVGAIVFDGDPSIVAPSTLRVATSAAPTSEPAASWSTLADVEREHIRATLAQAFYNQSEAARMLSIDRASLARKIARHQIATPTARRGRPHRG
ncbi:MAG TPA: sigma-54 dependent transcriptional regulator [Pirellulales bacterium]|nr:sigma-54 dependent transcriptional regulator [Pirellulales bacterium]